MIKVDEGKVTIRGTRPQLLTDITLAMMKYKELCLERGDSMEEVKADLNMILEVSLKTKDEIKDMTKVLMWKILEDMLGDMMVETDDEDDYDD